MFTKIERKYRDTLSEQRFWRFYLLRALLILALAIFVVIFLGFNAWLVAGICLAILFVLVGVFFWRDMRMVIGGNKPMKFVAKLDAYAKADEKLRLRGLVASLAENNFRTREDLKLAIEYFEQQRPVTAKTGVLEWVLSIAIALASVVAIAYNDEQHMVDNLKLLGIIGPTLQIVLMVVVPMFVVGILARNVFFSQAKIDSILIEDLAYIYVNFDKFATELQAK